MLMQMSSLVSSRSSFLLALLCIVAVVLSILVRTSDAPYVEKFPGVYKLESKQILLGLDGYYYLSLAKNIQQGEYSTLNPLRGVPDRTLEARIPPLLSALTAFVSSSLNITLMDVAVHIGVFIALLALIPVFLLARVYLESSYAALVCCFVAVNVAVVERSKLGWYDTDIFNVLFITLIIFLCARMEDVQENTKRWFLLLIWFVATALWALAWNTNVFMVVIFASIPLMTCLAVMWWKKIDAGFVKSLIALAFIVFLLLLFTGMLVEIAQYFIRHFLYLLNIDSGEFASESGFVSEQASRALGDTFFRMVGGWPGVLLTLPGIVYLWKSRRIESTYLALFVLFFVLSFFAERYILFAAFLGALLQACSLKYCCELLESRVDLNVRKLLIIVFPVVILWPSIHHHTVFASGPIYPAYLAKGLLEVEAVTEEDAVIWSWWDVGYPIQFFTDRATVGDGSLHGGMVNVALSVPSTVESQRAAANFIRFYVNFGESGVRDFAASIGLNDTQLALAELIHLFSIGPEASLDYLELNPKMDALTRAPAQIVEKIYSPSGRAIYWYLDERSATQMPLYLDFSNWYSGKEKEARLYWPLLNVGNLDDQKQQRNPEIVIDMENATIRFPSETISRDKYGINKMNTGTGFANFSELQMRLGGKLFSNSNGIAVDTTLSWNIDTGKAVLSDRSSSRSVLNSLYVLHRAEKYFQPVLNNNADFQLWKVEAEPY